MKLIASLLYVEQYIPGMS